MRFITGKIQGPQKKITYLNGLFLELLTGNSKAKRGERQTEKDKHIKIDRNIGKRRDKFALIKTENIY